MSPHDRPELREPHAVDGGQPRHHARPEQRQRGPDLPGPAVQSNRDYAVPIGSEAAGTAFKGTWSLSDVDEAWHGLIAEQEVVPRSRGGTDHLDILQLWGL